MIRLTRWERFPDYEIRVRVETDGSMEEALNALERASVPSLPDDDEDPPPSPMGWDVHLNKGLRRFDA